jgi:hypothetical protein
MHFVKGLKFSEHEMDNFLLILIAFIRASLIMKAFKKVNISSNESIFG